MGSDDEDVMSGDWGERGDETNEDEDEDDDVEEEDESDGDREHDDDCNMNVLGRAADLVAVSLLLLAFGLRIGYGAVEGCSDGKFTKCLLVNDDFRLVLTIS